MYAGDQVGHAARAGNWFLDGTLGYSGRSIEAFRSATTSLRGGSVEGKNFSAWSRLAIVPHWVRPAKWIFSTGWWIDERGDSRQWLIEVRTASPSHLNSRQVPA
ncbi:MAG: hypothetical protein HYZ58_07255 [Acidobacteria bacterium]|nr:hypothetical protein [Acidobacteriota bacterium]